jgi:hypothetical protein
VRGVNPVLSPSLQYFSDAGPDAALDGNHTYSVVGIFIVFYLLSSIHL